MNDWLVRQSTGLAQEFHHRPFPLPDPQDQHHHPGTTQFQPTVWIHRVKQPTLVLGSTQDESILETDKALAAGYEISTRRSGGGLVLVSPVTSCWIDILLPSEHPRWESDISVAFHWVGELWASALGELGVEDCVVHQGQLLDREYGRVLCFAGLGPGEVTLDDRKIVGLSQRRVRSGARFQGLLVSDWDSSALAQYVRPSSLPSGLNLEQVKAGHASLTPSIINALPDVIVSLLQENQRSPK